MPQMPRRRWYVAQIETGAPLAEAEACLVGHGFATFCPLERWWGRDRFSGKRRPYARPFFPGYLFVGLDLAETSWRGIDRSMGVRHLLPVGRELPAAVPLWAMRAIHQLHAEYAQRVAGEPPPAYSEGARIRLPSIGGREVTVLRSTQERVWFLLRILGTERVVGMRADRVEAA